MPVKNNSSSATTIKNMVSLMESDIWSIDRCLKYCNYNNVSIVQDEIILDKYYYYFEQYLITVDVDKKYYYSPQLFAKDYYGEADLDFIVLYFANMTSAFEFKKPQIKVLEYSHLQDLNKLFTSYKKSIEQNKKNPPVFSVSDVGYIKTSAKYIEEK